MAVTPMFYASADAKVLGSILRETNVGGIVTYEKLSESIARNVRHEAASVLHSARKMVQRESRIVFDCVRGIGLKRLTDEQVVDTGDKTRDHIRRTSKRAAKRITCVDYDALPKDKQVKHNTMLSMFGVFATIATEASTRRLSESVQASGAELPVVKASIAALGSIK